MSLTGGNRNDVTQLLPLLDKIPPVAGVVGRPRRRPDMLFAGRAASVVLVPILVALGLVLTAVVLCKTRYEEDALGDPEGAGLYMRSVQGLCANRGGET